jgi:hypothetical protein
MGSPSFPTDRPRKHRLLQLDNLNPIKKQRLCYSLANERHAVQHSMLLLPSNFRPAIQRPSAIAARDPTPSSPATPLAAPRHSPIAIQRPCSLPPTNPRPVLNQQPGAQAPRDPTPTPPSTQQQPRLPPPEFIPGSYRLRNDTLGKLASVFAARLDLGLSFSDLCASHCGPSCLSNFESLPHPASSFLATLRSKGAPAVQHTEVWPQERLDGAANRGPHQSTHEHIEFMRQEFSKMTEAGQWIVLPYSAVRLLPNLRLSPTGVVPQRDRRPRPIVDYTYSDVNDGTLSVAPDSIQFGTALTRFLQHLERADTRRGPIYLSKTDVADAFMRVWIALGSIPILGAILPTYPGEEAIVAFPMILPMGWVDSPSFLCAVMETIADLPNQRTSTGDLATELHHLDSAASTRPPSVPATPAIPTNTAHPPPTTRSSGPVKPPMTYTDVYMNDFLMATQLPNRKAVRSMLFECIDAVLRPLSPADNPSRKEPISIKKLHKGDASWSTRKSILGWLVDTTKRTIELPPHRIERLHEILASVPQHQHRTSRRKWQQLLGELGSMVLAIPGGRGLFSQLQSVLLHSPQAKPSDRLCLSQPVHDQLDDIRWLAENLRD